MHEFFPPLFSSGQQRRKKNSLTTSNIFLLLHANLNFFLIPILFTFVFYEKKIMKTKNKAKKKSLAPNFGTKKNQRWNFVFGNLLVHINGTMRIMWCFQLNVQSWTEYTHHTNFGSFTSYKPM